MCVAVPSATLRGVSGREGIKEKRKQTLCVCGMGGGGGLFLACCNCGDVLMRPHTNKQLFELSLAHVLCMQKYVVSVVESGEVKTKKNNNKRKYLFCP